jgi:hypothetical protein
LLDAAFETGLISVTSAAEARTLLQRLLPDATVTVQQPRPLFAISVENEFPE